MHLSAPADTTFQILESLVLDLCAVHTKLKLVSFQSRRFLSARVRALVAAIATHFAARAARSDAWMQRGGR